MRVVVLGRFRTTGRDQKSRGTFGAVTVSIKNGGCEVGKVQNYQG
jgi:hypothetical protein